MTERQKYIAFAVSLVVVAILSYALGRYVLPERVVVQEKVRVVEVEKEVLKVVEKEVVKKVYLEAESQRIHREKTEKTYPDGTQEKKETEDINVDKVVKDTEIQYVDRVVEKEVLKVVEKEVEKKVDVTNGKPNWKITPMVGLQIPDLYDTVTSGQLDIPSSLVYGGTVERRIWGPVSAGLWGLSNGSAGVAVTVEF